MGGGGWEEIFSFCASVRSQHSTSQLGTSGMIMSSFSGLTKKGLHWNLLLELPAKQNKSCISVSSDPQLYRNTHFNKVQKSMIQQKMQFNRVSLSHQDQVEAGGGSQQPQVSDRYNEHLTYCELLRLLKKGLNTYNLPSGQNGTRQQKLFFFFFLQMVAAVSSALTDKNKKNKQCFLGTLLDGSGCMTKY